MAPWSSFWDRNGLAMWYPAVDSWLGSPFVRGAVTGIGLLTAVAGLIELAGVFGARRPGDATDPVARD